MAEHALVTGAAGFIGSRLVPTLLDEGWQVTAVVRPSVAVSLPPWLRDVEVIEADLTDSVSIRTPGPADVAFHLAAVGLHESTPRHAEQVMRGNVLATLGAFRLATGAGVRRVVHLGSGLEYGPGTRLHESTPAAGATPYGASKAAAWLLARSLALTARLELVGLRPFTVYGPGDSPEGLISSAIAAALDDRGLELTEGLQTRDFVFVDDVVQAVLTAATRPQVSGDVFNVCTGVETSIRQIVELVFTLVGGSGSPKFGARPTRENELRQSSGDPTKARERLGWQATTSPETGLSATITKLKGRAAAAATT